ncbi:MAG TPA: Lrp/AsnC family transcriptional regulator [Chitinophagaceae bacterium]|jgi:Lrp/AsnC family leucine-responsive transcriptional regulator
MTRDRKLDEVDLKIMQILQQNGRMETVHIATKVCRSPRATLDRIEQLAELGFIERFAAILNRKLVGRPTLIVTLVKLKSHSAEQLKAFATTMQFQPEVQVVLHLSGEYDYLLHVSLRDPAEYEDFLEQKLCNLPMVDKVHSSVVLKEYKMDAAIPIYPAV